MQSAQLAVRSGFKTQAQVVAEMGGDLEELLMARKNEIEMSEQLGLMFDTDPTVVARVTDEGRPTKVDTTSNKKVDDGDQT